MSTIYWVLLAALGLGVGVLIYVRRKHEMRREAEMQREAEKAYKSSAPAVSSSPVSSEPRRPESPFGFGGSPFRRPWDR